MWIIIRGVRYNFNIIGFYYALGKTVILVDVEYERAEEINIKCDSPKEANELVEKIDNQLGTLTL